MRAMCGGKTVKKRTLFVLAAVVVAAAMIAGCTSTSNPSPSATSTAGSPAVQNTVTMKSLAFTPSTLTVKQGANVTWGNADSTTHTVTSDTGLFDSGNLSPGDSFTHQFNATGTFLFHCTIHPSMKGTIVVQ
jgi:plastocyanin